MKTRLHPHKAWAEVYTRRLPWTHPEHVRRFEKADRARRLGLFWIRGVTS